MASALWLVRRHISLQFVLKIFLYPLQAGQAVMYSNQVPLSKAALALNERIFNRYSFFFWSEYAAKISSKAQWERFLMKIGGGRAKRAPATSHSMENAQLCAKDCSSSLEVSLDVSWQPSDSVQANFFDAADSDSTW